LLSELQPTADRFETAKSSLESIYRTRRTPAREVPWQVYRWGLLGFDGDPRPREWEIVRAATLDELTQFGRRVLKGSYRVVVIGDPSRVDMAALRTIAPVSELTPDSLFSWGPFPSENAAASTSP